MRRQLRASMIVFVVSLALSVGADRALAVLVTGSVEISGSRTSPAYMNGATPVPSYNWSFGYNTVFDGTRLLDRVGIDFEYDAVIAASEPTFTPYLKSTIETLWGNRFFLRDNSTGNLYPVGVEVVTDGSLIHRSVQVSQGFVGDAANLNQWFDNDEPGVFAHEFGHALGLFDEYLNGAVDQFPNPTLSSDGIMGLGARKPSPKFFERYFTHFISDMLVINPGGSFSLVAVPEPAAWLLAALALIGMAGSRRVRRTT